MAKHTFIMNDEFDDARNGTPHYTRIEMEFETDLLTDLIDEFTSYLQHCGYTYVDSVEAHSKTFNGKKDD